MKQIFISYAPSDFQTAQQMYDLLQKAGLNPWMDTNILPGEHISNAVRQAIRESDYFIALLSQKALSKSGRIHKELLLAKEKSEENPDHKIFVIPVRLDNCKVENEFLLDIQPLDLFQSPEKELEKLLRVFIPENTEKDKTDSPSLLSRIDPEIIQKMIEQFKSRHQKPVSRKFLSYLTAGILLFVFLIAAILYYSDFFHFHNQQVSDCLKSAHKYLNRGMYAEAGKEYERALKLCDKCPEAMLGEEKVEIFSKMAKPDYDSAAMSERLQRIREKHPNDPHALLLLGNLNLQEENQTEAENHYRKATEKEPEFAEAWFSLGTLYHRQKKTEKAFEMFQKAVGLSPSSLRYKDYLTWMYFETGEYGKAIELYEKILNADANFLLAYAEIAKVLWMDNKPENALQYLRSMAENAENDEIANLPVNSGPWFFPVENESVILDNLTAKKYYAAYSLAATCWLLGLASEAETSMKKAEMLKIGDTDLKNIKILIDQELSDIQEKYAENREIRNRAEEFRTRFLTAD